MDDDKLASEGGPGSAPERRPLSSSSGRTWTSYGLVLLAFVGIALPAGLPARFRDRTAHAGNSPAAIAAPLVLSAPERGEALGRTGHRRTRCTTRCATQAVAGGIATGA